MSIKALIFMAVVGIMSGIVSIYYFSQKEAAEEPLYVSYNPYDKGIYAAGMTEADPSDSSFMLVRCFVNSLLVNNLPKNSVQAMMFIRGKNTAPLALEFLQMESSITTKDGIQVPLLFKLSADNIVAGQPVDVYIKEELSS